MLTLTVAKPDKNQIIVEFYFSKKLIAKNLFCLTFDIWTRFWWDQLDKPSKMQMPCNQHVVLRVAGPSIYRMALRRRPVNSQFFLVYSFNRYRFQRFWKNRKIRNFLSPCFVCETALATFELLVAGSFISTFARALFDRVLKFRIARFAVRKSGILNINHLKLLRVSARILRKKLSYWT